MEDEDNEGGVAIIVVGGAGKDAIVAATINCHHC
jgi:hypothetical protein